MALIFYKSAHENLLDSECECLVNPTNSVGVMGAGLAKQFRARYPDVCYDFNSLSSNKLAEPCLYLSKDVLTNNEHYVMMFPTKIDWRKPSEYHYIERNMPKAIQLLRDKDIKSVAFPKLGCGFGTLNWNIVHQIMAKEFEWYEGTVHIYT